MEIRLPCLRLIVSLLCYAYAGLKVDLKKQSNLDGLNLKLANNVSLLNSSIPMTKDHIFALKESNSLKNEKADLKNYKNSQYYGTLKL